MTGNTLFLVCTPCLKANEAEYGIKIATRTRKGWYEPKTPPKEFKNWLAKHNGCAGEHGPDHFQLAHVITPNSDQRTIEDAYKISTAVSGALHNAVHQ